MDWVHGIVDEQRGQVHGGPVGTWTRGMAALFGESGERRCLLANAPRHLELIGLSGGGCGLGEVGPVL
jgi:hypothetical protein